MSTYKQFTSKDVIITPFSLGKQFTYEGTELTATDVEIDFFQGINNTTRFDEGLGSVLPQTTTGLINTQYKELVYNDIKQLYYTNYLPNNDSQFFPSTSSYFIGTTNQNHRYENYLASLTNDIRYFPTESNAEVTVISIPSKCYGNYIRPKSFAFTYGNTTIYDDGEGNLYTPVDTTFSVYGSAIYGINVYGDTASPRKNIGNIIYSHGIVTITSGSLTGLGTTITGSFPGGYGPSTSYWTDSGITENSSSAYSESTGSNFATGSYPAPFDDERSYQIYPGGQLGLAVLGGNFGGLFPWDPQNQIPLIGVIGDYANNNFQDYRRFRDQFPSNLGTICRMSASSAAYYPTSSILIADNFGFNIPSDATIERIHVYLGRMWATEYDAGGNDMNFLTLHQVRIAPTASALSFTGPGIDATAGSTYYINETSYPGEDFRFGPYLSDPLWGQTWTPSQINDSKFCVGISLNQFRDLTSTGIVSSVQNTGSIGFVLAKVKYSISGSYTPAWSNLSSASISFESDVQVYENQYKCTFGEDEFNFSLNPSNLSGSNIMYNGSALSGYTGNSDKVFGFITGSSFTPYITTVGLYNNNQELIAVGKLSQPLQSSRNTDTTLLVNFDT